MDLNPLSSPIEYTDIDQESISPTGSSDGMDDRTLPTTSHSAPATPIRETAMLGCQTSSPDSSPPLSSTSPLTVPPSSSSSSATAAAGKRAMRIRSISTSSAATRTRTVQSGNRTIYTAGRPPWYNSQGQISEPFVIGICGGSASGKTTVAKMIIETLNIQWVSLLSMDSFYKVLTKEQHDQALASEYNFDCPDAFDFDLVVQTLKRLKEGKNVEVPIYNFSTHGREKDKKTVYGANVIIFEGIMAFATPEMLECMDMKVFVDTDSDIRLARRLKRDICERGRDLHSVFKQYQKFVKPAFDRHIEPMMVFSDIIVPRGGENVIAVDLIVNHVSQKLVERGFKFRHELTDVVNGQPNPTTLHVLQSTEQIRGLHTFIRNKEVVRDEFIFYSKRLMRLLIESAMSILPFKDHTVKTPQGTLYRGKKMDTEKICGVSILRAGETLEPALCEVCKDIRIGKMLIQTNTNTGEPELHYLRLPKDIKNHYVFLLDATVATGAAAIMAIRVLLDHEVPEDHVILLSLIMGESGVHSVAYAYPQVNIFTTAVDTEVNKDFHIVPGIGNFGDRYFGTENNVSKMKSSH